MSSSDPERPLTEVERKLVEAMVDEIQSEPISPAGALGIQLAKREGDPSALLGAIRQALKIQPEHLGLRLAAENLADKLSKSPVVVLVERVRCSTGDIERYEGRVYVEEADGRLRPASGDDLMSVERHFPGFLKNWRLPEDEY